MPTASTVPLHASRNLSVVIHACLAGTLCATAHAEDVPLSPATAWQSPQQPLDGTQAMEHARTDTVDASMTWTNTPRAADGRVVPDAEEVTFDESFLGLGPGGASIDISRFNKGNVITAGSYLLDVVTNGVPLGRQSLRFADVAGKPGAQLCLDRSVVTLLGVDLERVERARTERAADWEGIPDIPDQAVCGDLADYVHGANAVVDLASQRLEVTVPQLYATRMDAGGIDHRLWDPGINAAIVTYRLNAHHRHRDGASSRDLYAEVDGGINAGAWQLRHRGSQSWRDDRRQPYASVQTLLRRDIPALGARLTIGESGSASDLFDSVSMRGFILATDDRMLPGDNASYVPRIRGMAVSNAKVSVYQAGQLIHETSVSPGPFELDDVNPPSQGGDLLVEVTEASGNITRFIVPYSTTTRLLPKGISRWSASAGQLQSSGLDDAPWMFQGTWQHGLSDRLTAYAGIVGLSAYRAAQVGMALNTRIGAFSLDTTHARTRLPGGSDSSGSNWQLRYSKMLSGHGTTLNVSGYRYATSGYAGLQDAVRMLELVRSGKDPAGRTRPRQRIDISINQNLGARGGQLHLNAAAQHYDDARTTSRDWSIGYSNALGPVTMSLNAQRTWITDAQQGRTFADNRIHVMASVPLGRRAPVASSLGQLSVAASRSDQAGTSQDLTYTGSSARDDRWSYATTISRDAQASVSHAASGTYAGDRMRFSARYSGGNATALSAGMGGTAVLHAGGVQFTSRTGDTFALIHAQGAAGARLRGRDNTVRLDRNGYGLTAVMTPYRLNNVELDAEGTSMDVELMNTMSSAAPHQGAVVRLEYPTRIGRLLTLHAIGVDGEPLPFGADVLDADGASVGVVAQAGMVVARGVEEGQWLQVRWGEGEARQCALRVPMQLKEDDVACSMLAASATEAIRASSNAGERKSFGK